MTVNARKLKEIVFDLGGDEFQVQLKSWTLKNDTKDPDLLYTYGGDDETFAEENEPEYSLDLEFYSDWRADGISDFLTAHDGETIAFTITHHPGVSGEAHQRAGQVLVKAPDVGGDVRDTEVTKTTLAVIGKPSYTRL